MSRLALLVIIGLCGSTLLIGCPGPQTGGPETPGAADADSGTGDTGTGTPGEAGTTPPGGEAAPPGAAPPLPPPTSPLSALIQPDDLVYLGAFRLPEGSNWGGMALTYYPGGDPDGPADGTPGSLFLAGHDQFNFVSEISIPIPSLDRNLEGVEIKTAGTLQDFADLRLPDFLYPEGSIPQIGLAYLPAQGDQESAKLYQSWGRHFEGGTVATHTWSELNLAAPDVQGPWRVANQSLYSVTDYMFEIPAAWAAAYTPGQQLVTGRYRDGGWSGQGPVLIAIGPWNEGNPPAANSNIAGTPLLLYDRSEPGPNHCIDENDPQDCTPENQNPQARTVIYYHHSDEWSGGAWLTAGAKAAVIFVGTKGTGNHYWYGDYQGVCPGNECGDEDRGWYSEGFEAQIIFYDPADLAAVAQGSKQPYEPQPYAHLVIDNVLFSEIHMMEHRHIPPAQQKMRLGAAAYDPANRLLYIIERFADGEKPLVHAWRVRG